MFPRFSDMLNSLWGTNFNLPIQTYGFFMALAFVLAGFLVYLELKRKENEGIIPIQTKETIKGKPASLKELLFTALLYAVFGFKITGIVIDYQIFAENPQQYILSAEGSFIGGLVFFAGTAILIYLKRRKEKSAEPVVSFTQVHAYQLTPGLIIIAAFSGILGAKFFDIIEHLDDFFRDPVGQVFAFSGLTFYGGLIVAAFVVGIYGERNKIKWSIMADAVAPALMLAYAVGRVGCQLSGDGCWGIPNLSPKPGWMTFLPDWMWAFNFPHNVINHGVMIPGCDGNFCFELAQPVFPTSFYETVICVLFFLILWFIRKRIRIAGILFSIYLILNGFERFVIEQVRVNIKYQVLNFQITQAEIIALILIFAGISGLVFFTYQNRKLLQKNVG